MRLDILSAILTVFSMTEIGQKRWQGWALAFANCVVVCILAVHVAPKQWALIPPNVLCLFIYARNLWNWKHAEDPQDKKAGWVVKAGRSETHRNLVGYLGEFVTNLAWPRRADVDDPIKCGGTLGSVGSNALSNTGHEFRQETDCIREVSHSGVVVPPFPA
jgi:hypothetical protein